VMIVSLSSVVPVYVLELVPLWMKLKATAEIRETLDGLALLIRSQVPMRAEVLVDPRREAGFGDVTLCCSYSPMYAASKPSY